MSTFRVPLVWQQMWTHTTEPAEYVDFLWRLLKHIATREPSAAPDGVNGDGRTGGGRGAAGAATSLYLWKDDRDISYDPCYAEWEESGSGRDHVWHLADPICNR